MARAALSRSRGRHSAPRLPDARRAGGGATGRRGARDSEEDRVARLVEPGTRDATCRAGAADRWLSASLSLRAIYSFAPSFRSWCAPAVQRVRMKSPTMWRCLFFQAEDGIRDRNVTGVQTCALPIFLATLTRLQNNKARTAQALGISE